MNMEVLTQSQIDALLNSVQSGEMGEPQVFEDASKKERKYDFRTPKKFTKDELKLLDSVYSNYARVISSHLTSILRLACEVNLIDIEEQKYFEFNNALNENDILSVININMPDAKYEPDPVLMQISNPIVYSMMNRMLGGEGDTDNEDHGEFTDIEIELYSGLIHHIVPLMDNSWQNYYDIKFKFSNVEVNPRLMQTVSTDDTVVIVVLDITINDVTGTINICLPGNALEVILKSFEAGKSTAHRRKESENGKAQTDILYNISGSMLEVRVNLGNSQVMLKDILNMKRGDIINLNKSRNADAVVCVEDKPWFTGELGMQKQNVAVKINGFVTD